MTLTAVEMDRKIEEHFGFERSDDVEHDVVGWPAGPAHGRERARPFYEALFADLSESRVECLRRLYGDGFVIDESLWRGKAPGRPFGLEGRGRPLEFRMLHVVEFSESGQIRRENVWVDLAAIIGQLPQA